jgi:SAM-dependent methyltransferase
VSAHDLPAADAGYITDVAYTGNFAQSLAPAWLAYIAAINGYAAPAVDRPFAYCELGCGKGVTSLVLAAMHPAGEFHACDLNPAHIEYAGRLRRAAGIDNVQFHPRSVADMLAAELPHFDFIAAHGLYSWVPEAVRVQIREFVRTRLKPGGLFLVSYNALPGWAHLQPVRAMMRTYAERVPGDSLAKAHAAFAYVRRLAEVGAGYFRTNPTAAAHLAEIARHDIRYVAHEYLTPHGDPFYFADVERAMRSAHLAFAGSMTPADNYPALMVPDEFRDAFAGGASRTALEMHRDFVANTAFRQDLYAKQAQQIAPADLPLERLDGLAFALARLPEDLALSSSAGAVRFDLAQRAPAVRAVHALLAAGPAPAREIHRAAGLGAEGETSFLIQQLVVARHLVPCPAARVSAGWPRVNVALVDAAIQERLTQTPLACPAIASATTVETVHAAVIEAAALFGETDAAARSVLARLRAAGHPVDRAASTGERRPATDAEIHASIAATWRVLRDGSSADARLLRLLGVLGGARL